MNSVTIIIVTGAGIGLALVFAFLFGIARDRRRHARGGSEPDCSDRTRSSPVALDYYPGEPQGYAGFTDHHAMMQAITDDLVDREAEWQFGTIGFANGFLSGVLAVAGGRNEVRGIVRAVAPAEADAAAIGWLARMQVAGAENAPPSTANLASAVRRIALQIASEGPCRAGYWSGTSEHGRTQTGMDPAALAALVEQMRVAERRGNELGDRARFTASGEGEAE